MMRRGIFPHSYVLWEEQNREGYVPQSGYIYTVGAGCYNTCG